jgi:hypothetical protein
VFELATNSGNMNWTSIGALATTSKAASAAAFKHANAKKFGGPLNDDRKAELLLRVRGIESTRCAYCHRTTQRVDENWGIRCHVKCVREHLINTYYVEDKYNLKTKEYSHIPSTELIGWRPRSKEQYTCK